MVALEQRVAEERRRDASAHRHEAQARNFATHTPARGLCAQCRNEAECTFAPRLEGRAVRWCDEFDGAGGRAEMREVAPVTRSTEERGRPRLGLCANCDNFDGCTFPKPEGGVWSCDEYV